MLRASTLGLRDHHDKSCFIFWICRHRLLPVLAIDTLVQTGSSRGPVKRVFEPMAGWRTRRSATLGKSATIRDPGRSPFGVTNYRELSTFPSVQVTATSSGSTYIDSPSHVQSMEQIACARTTETSPLRDINDVSRSTSQRFAAPEDVRPVSPDNINADMKTASSSPHNDNGATNLLNIMATTTSAWDAWAAYEHLKTLQSLGHVANIPISLLRRLSRLLSQTKPRTRPLFLRLLSVLSDLHRRGSPVQLWQWNALIDCAGRGWRKTRSEEFKNALEVFEDLITQRAPGATFSEDGNESYRPMRAFAPRQNIVPDIVTFTTLVNIAGRTKDEQAIHYAMSLLGKAGLAPNRITYLSLIRYFTRTKQLSSVQSTLHTMKEKGEELGPDGVNACIWAYGYNGRVDIASTIYRVLRHQYLPEDGEEAKAVQDAIKRLSTSEAIDIPPALIPDATTYHTLIQVYAYHGDFNRCIQTFIAMISFPDNVSIIADRMRATSPTEAGVGSPTLTAYRAIFLGFARHGQLSTREKKRSSYIGSQEPSPWNEKNLYTLFHAFLRLPNDVKPSERTIYWLLMGFCSTIGQPSIPRHRIQLRHIWEHLETRFGGGWGGRLERLRKEIYKP